VLNLSALAANPVLVGELVRLEPLGPAHALDNLASTRDPELRRLTGTHREFTLEEIEQWCASRAEQTDRVDLAVLDAADKRYLGDLALFDVDRANASACYRIALSGKGNLGRGYGTEATSLVLDYAFDAIGLHRVWLEVFAFNERAIRAYRRCGFVVDGRLRDALRWNGQWHDALAMSALSTDETRRPTRQAAR
jgi:RimJ/RimL family protein N-acetyltransferase